MSDIPSQCIRTIAKTEYLVFVWQIEGFSALRKLARLKGLPSKDRLFSPEFGNPEAGSWKIALFPYGDREAGKHVSLYLFGDKSQQRRVAEFSMVVLDADSVELSGTWLSEDPTFFTSENNSWGWHEFLSVENDEQLKQYLVGDCLKVKVTVKVYTGVVNDESPRALFNIVHRKCLSLTDSDEDSSDSSIANGTHANNGAQQAPRRKPFTTPQFASSRGAPDACPSLTAASNDSHVMSSSSSPWLLPRSSLQDDVAGFALSEFVQDVTLVCDGRHFTANRFLLGARSGVFSAMLFGQFRESQQTEINILDVSADVVADFLLFIATDSCPPIEEVAAGDLYSVDRLLRLLQAADKYQVLGLQSRCIQALGRCISAETVIDIIDAAEELNCSPLVEACRYYLRHSRKIDQIVDFVRRRRSSSSESSLEKNAACGSY